MPSSDKTPCLGLNRWQGSDTPKRVDFNSDNEILDRTISAHQNDATAHVTHQERERWDEPYTITYYVGDSQAERIVPVPAGTRLCIVFQAGAPMQRVDFSAARISHNFGIATEYKSTYGLSLEADGLHVFERTTADFGAHYMTMNTFGKTYVCVFFR